MVHTWNNSFFSIIIPTLNEEHYISLLLNDLDKQTFKDFEVIIVDAKSKDKTREKAEKFKDKFRIFRFIISNKKNVSHQRNLGAKFAKADWIIFFDADNRLPVNFLKEIKNHIKSKKADLLSSLISSDSQLLKYKLLVTWMNSYIQFLQFLKQNRLNEAFLCIRTKVFRELGGFGTYQPGEGNDLLKRSREKKYVFENLKYPKYTFSLRRLRKDGTFIFALKYAYLETLGMLNIGPFKKIGYKLYPMGGNRYKNKSTRSYTN